MLKFPLRSTVSITAFIAVVIAATLMLGAYAIRFALAQELIDTNNTEHALWAVRLDPKNALIQNRAGFLYQWQTAGTSKALPYLQRATELNPRVAAYWNDLANSCELAGQLECARGAYEKAVMLAPMH